MIAGNGVGMVFANNILRALLSVCSQIAVDQVVAAQTLVSRDSGAFENRQRETWKSTHVNHVCATPVAALTELLHANST